MHPVIGLVLQVAEAEQLPQSLVSEGLDPLLRVSKQGPYLTAIEDGFDKRLVELELAREADGVAQQAPVWPLLMQS